MHKYEISVFRGNPLKSILFMLCGGIGVCLLLFLLFKVLLKEEPKFELIEIGVIRSEPQQQVLDKIMPYFDTQGFGYQALMEDAKICVAQQNYFLRHVELNLDSRFCTIVDEVEGVSSEFCDFPRIVSVAGWSCNIYRGQFSFEVYIASEQGIE